MKKLLSVLALVGAGTVATVSATSCNSGQNVENELYKAQVNSPKIYLQEGTTMDDEALNVYILQFVKITFDYQIANDKYTVSVDKGNLDLNVEGVYTVKLNVAYGNFKHTYETFVEVANSARNTVKITSTGDFTFTPQFTGSILPDYKDKITVTDWNSNNKTIVWDTLPQNSGEVGITVDDSTVRYAVPGTHLVKYTITNFEGKKQYIYKDVVVRRAKLTTKAELETLFDYSTSEGLSCKKDDAVLWPNVLLVPSRFDDNGKIVEINNYKAWGCDFKHDYNTPYRGNYRDVDTMILEDGHKVVKDGWFAVDYWNAPSDLVGKPSLRSVHLPETVTRLEGEGAFAGSNIKSIIIPRSVQMIDSKFFNNTWKLESSIFLGMPTSNSTSARFQSAGTLAVVIERFFQTNGRKSVYFYADYMVGISSDWAKNKLFREIYDWAKETDHVANINSFVNFNKIILD